MSDKIFHIIGHIIARESREGLAGLRVEAWDKDLICDDFLGSAVTDDQGAFNIEFSESHFRELFLDRQPDLFFKVFYEKKLIKSTEDSVLWNVAAGETEIEIEVKAPTDVIEPKPPVYRVSGRILAADGTPVVGAMVRAFDKDLRSEEELGKANGPYRTNSKGYYEITYTPAEFRRAEKQSADLVVRVYDAQGNILKASEIYFNAQPEETMDLTVGETLSEYERYMATIDRVRDDVPMSELNAEDILFLNGETGIDAGRIEFLVAAAHLAEQTELPSEVFYGLARHDLPTTLPELFAREFWMLHQALETALDENIIPSRLREELEQILAHLRELAGVSPEDDPLHQIKLQPVKVRKIGEAAGLEASKIEAVLQEVDNPAALSDELLESLVEAETLQDQEARELGLTASLYHLFDENLALANLVKQGTYPQIPGGRVAQIKDLVALKKEDWLIILTAAEAKPPKGLVLEEYATLLTKKMEYLYPTDALLARVVPQDNGNLVTDMERLQPLFEKNDTLFGADDSTSLNVKGIDVGEVENLCREHKRLARFANMYPGMRIGELLDDREMSAVDKARQVGERVGLLRTLQEKNPKLELLKLDYSLESDDLKALNFGEMTPDEQRMVLSTVKSYQRAYSITNDVEHTQSLAAAGYHSALNIVNDSLDGFLKNTDLNSAAGTEYYDKAHATVGSTTMAAGSVLDVVGGGFDWTVVANIMPSIKNFLKKIDGFDDLFGSQNYCHCEHCQSILSPAAYFVDLMYFVVEQKILSKHFTGNKADHVLNLKNRRPDLWTLPLTCENTNKLVPYLDIINEILENYIAVRNGFPKGQLTDRSKVEEDVYGKYLPKGKYSFQQPFLLPLEELHLYLSHFSKTQGEIARLLEAEQDIISQTTLKLSKDEYKLIITVNTKLTFLEKMYSVQFKVSGSSGKVAAFDARSLLKPMGLTREELGELIETNFVTAGKTKSIQIKGEKTDSDSVQNDIERIYGLTTASLDRMHRFTRLWRTVSSWSIIELDLVLYHLDKEKLAGGIGAGTLKHIVTILAVQERFSISVEESCALWSDLPSRAISAEPLLSVDLNMQNDLENGRLSSDFKASFQNCGISLSTKISITSEKESGFWRINDTGLGRMFIVERMSKTLNIYSEDKDDFFDRLFNLPSFVLIEKFPRDSSVFIHPSLIKSGTTVGENNLHRLHRLLAGLQVSDENLYLLIKKLKLDSPQGFTLTTANLSLLYRHARLAEWLKLSVTKLFQLINLGGTISSDHIENMSDLSALLKFYDWWKTTDYTLDDLSFITGGQVQDSSAYLNEETISEQLLNKVQTDGALTFTDTAFAFLEGVTEEQSRAIVAKANADNVIVEASGTRYRLADSYKSTDQLVIPAGVGTSVTQAKLKALLATYQISGAPPFAGTLFTSIAEVTKKQSKAIIKANPILIVPVSLDKTYWLTDSFDPTGSLTIPNDIPVLQTDVRSLLLTYHVGEVIPGYLSGLLGFSAEKTKQLIKMAGADLTEAAYTKELQGKESTAKLTNLIGKLLPLSVLFKDKSFDTAALKFIQGNFAMFGISDFNALDIESVHSVSLYHGLVDELDTNDLQRILPKFDPTGKFPANVQDTLADILGVARGLTFKLQKEISLPNTALKAFDKLFRCVETAKYLGVGGDALKLIISQKYEELAQANTAVLSAFRAKYDDEEEWEQKIEPFENKIRAFKRDALADYLIHAVHPEFTSLNDLYYHFLIDVELEGCARTSKLVAAISSVQLYIHRCLMNLEQDAKAPGETDRVHVKPEDVPSDEYVWRKNYRVWEANRKVFLYPETYVEPELRDNKTPLFKELESELLQKEINKQTALDAYGRYMRGFVEVSRLKIAGAYHDIQANTDILHLFGVTPGDPPTYYYRTVENAYYGEVPKHRKDHAIAWNSWQKIDVQIPVRKVAPIIFRGQLYVFWVEITTSPKNVVIKGNSNFVGYQHKMALKFTSLRLDGTWTAPQMISLRDKSSFRGEGIIDDLLGEASEFKQLIKTIASFDFNNLSTATDKMLTPKYDSKLHLEPEDGYTLTGFLWDQVYPKANDDKSLSTIIAGIERQREIDFYNKALVVPPSIGQPSGVASWRYWDRVLYAKGKDPSRRLYSVRIDEWPIFGEYACRSVVLEQDRLDKAKRYSIWKTLRNRMQTLKQKQMKEIAHLNTGDALAVVNGSVEDCIIDSKGDLLLLQGSVWERKNHLLKRLGTMCSEKAARTLFTRGVDKLLDIETQKDLEEPSLPIWYDKKYVTDTGKEGKTALKGPDFKGPYGVYYREIFFHIPFLIANHLNSKQKFSLAQKWYHYIFNPTAEVINVSGSSLSSEDKKKKLLDRNWRYIEFRGLDTQKLRDQLIDAEAIQAYKKDPFNPHAIARLRLSAYQKCIVMKYIDNLLDWGDYLFAQDTMESVNEATLLYVMAADILGERPAEIGSCGEGTIQPKTYERIASLMKKNKNPEFLIEMEHNVVEKAAAFEAAKTKAIPHYASDQFAIKSATSNAYVNLKNTPPILSQDNIAYAEANVERRSSAASVTGSREAVTSAVDGIFLGENWKADSSSSQIEIKRTSSIGLSFVAQISIHTSPRTSPVFCVPRNNELALYWDRVEDRLYKIRHCMNIKGVGRQLALFAPEIDPRLLVRAKAAGLSIDDVLSSISGNLPPYRFSYLIEKAKSYAATVQGFGQALLSALEKKDAEDLNLLRTVHEQNILKLTTQTRQNEIKAADEAIKALQERIEAVTYRQGYYKELVIAGLISSESTQQSAQETSSGLRIAAGILDALAGVSHLLPQLGNPFAMKYGGLEIGNSVVDWSMVMRDIAGVFDAISASAGLEASFERRKQEWEHQKTLATHELEELEKQLQGAKIHKEIAQDSLKIHKKTIEQTEDIYKFHKDKFSNLGLYTWLSTTLQRLHREAYNCAYSAAKLAEQAYCFERGDESGVLLGIGYWQTPKAGLLAGDRLLVDLQNLERKFMETNYRGLEINQSFSLAQIDPAALIKLRETGTCDFNVAEIFFDMFYPGHYRRKIKAVRLTIPCVTGPYTNVSATLTLKGSRLRNEAKLGSTHLKVVPRSRSVSIATSSAQNDTGVFELNFCDERYMPFEGAGAISSWELSLPENFKQFDYRTISDVILHISYTAEEDGTFRGAVEKVNGATQGALINILTSQPLAQAYSLRHDFSNELYKLLHSPLKTSVEIEISDIHFPIFLKCLTKYQVNVTNAKLILQTSQGQTANNFKISINGFEKTGFAADKKFGGLWTKDLENTETPLKTLFKDGIQDKHTLAVVNAGDLGPDAPASGDTFAIDSQKLTDIILYLEYKVIKKAE